MPPVLKYLAYIIFVLVVLYLIVVKYPDQFKLLATKLSESFGLAYSGIADNPASIPKG